MTVRKLIKTYALASGSLMALATSTGCATVAAMSPCEKAAVARKAAEKAIEAIDAVCPLAQAQDEAAEILAVTDD